MWLLTEMNIRSIVERLSQKCIYRELKGLIEKPSPL